MRVIDLSVKILLSAVLAAWCVAAAAEGRALQTVPDSPPAPGLDLPDLTGKPFAQSEVDGRVVLVNFWATWCPPCRKEMPSLQRLSERLSEEPFVVLGVNVGEDPERIEDFLRSLPEYPGFPILLDRDGEASRAWQARVVPTTWVVDREGHKVLGAVGEVDFDNPELVDRLRALIETEPHRDDPPRSASQ